MIRRISRTCANSLSKTPSGTAALLQRRLASSKPQPSTEPQSQQNATKDEAAASTKAPKTEKPAVHHKTMAELDEEMKAKMSGISGDGGSSGVEYEDGEPVSMKRSVKNNMFRYI